MVKQRLGQLEEVDLRSIWADEARDFTPWLAEHLDELGTALGLDLELIEQESAHSQSTFLLRRMKQWWWSRTSWSALTTATWGNC